MSDTPRVDDKLKQAQMGTMWVDSRFARHLERELNEALKWKDEDPRMLREQMRVADSAFQRLHEENQELKIEVERLENLTCGIHSCSNQCQRPMCVLRRNVEALNEKNQELGSAIKYLSETARRYAEAHP